MHRWWRSLVWLLAVVAVSPAPSAAPKKLPNRFVPPDGSCLLIIGQDRAAIDAHVARLNVRPAGVMSYTSLKSLEGLSAPAEYDGVVQDAAYLRKTYANSVLQLGLYLVGALEDVVQGKLDGNIDKLGDWIQGAGCPVYLRVGYEFDLPENKYPPDVYVRAFRRIRERLDQRGVVNVAYVWHSYAAANAARAADWYPGDAYVDWVAVSYFSPRQPHLEAVAEFARAHGKPLMIAEATPRGIGTGKGQASWEGWFVPYLAYAARHRVKALCYIDKDWEASPRWKGQGWGDSRIAANDLVRKNWLKEVGAKRYLKASDRLFQTLGYPPARK